MTVCFFTHTDWFYAVNPFCSSLNCCFRLQITVHRLAVLLTVFWRKKRAKSVSAEKWKSYECRSYLFSVSMKLQFHKTWITLTSNSKTLQIFFSCAYNTIYTFAKFLLRLQILFALAVLCTLSQILPYACKSLWRKITHIDVFISMRRGRAWKKRACRTATASLPLWARIPRVYIWNNELKRAKDAICERPLKTPVLSVCIVLVIFCASFFFCPLFAAVFPRSDFFLLSNECVLKCSEVQYFPQNILK